jgi:GT2 family glycosyltransferase
VAEQLLDVEISIVNTNSRELLRGCLESLPAACDDLRWRATVVDNASSDGSAEMVSRDFPWARLIENSATRGFSANHNEVLRRGLDDNARYILILNEDTVLQAGSVHNLVQFCDAHQSVGAAGPIIEGADGNRQQSFFSFPTLLDQAAACLFPGRQPRTASRHGWLNGSCVLVRAAALREIGLLDERFFIFFEDTDLGLRLHQAGWESAVCPSAHILHYGHQVVSQPTYGNRMERQMLRSRYLYFRKHRGAARARFLGVVVRGALLLRAAKAFASGAFLRKTEERVLATVLWGLASYDPARLLPHERGVGIEAR